MIEQKELDDLQKEYDEIVCDRHSQIIECSIVIRTILDMRPLRTYNEKTYLYGCLLALQKRTMLNYDEKRALRYLTKYFDDLEFQKAVINYMELAGNR
jgi:hypothetical protein